MAEPSRGSRIRRFARENSLSLVFLGLFLAALTGQAIAGHNAYNHDQVAHGEATISLWTYVTSSSFGRAVMENWQSEYLQFSLFVLATIWFVQRGSPESKPVERAGKGSDREARIGRWASPRAPLWARTGDLRTVLYSNSLLIVMALIFFGSWFAQSVTGWTDFNAAQHAHGEQAVSWIGYVGSSEFWEGTLQNWQSEFLAVGSFVILAVFLRQRGSPESKPVGAAHEETDVED